jgi:uncharacterized protein YqeY
MTKQKLQEELMVAMKAQDEVKKSTLRMLLSGINYYEIQKGGAGYLASEEDVLSVIQKEAKNRRDSIAEYEKAGRQDLVDKETAELNFLQAYLPAQMSEEEITKIIEETITETGATTMADMGKLMGALTGKLKGKADMGIVSNLVRSKLTS